MLDTFSIAEKCKLVMIDKKSSDVLLLDVRKINSYLDYIVIATSSSKLHSRALAREIRSTLAEYETVKPRHFDDESEWILIDFGFVTVNIFTYEAREFYSLEKLWGDAAKL